MKESLYREIPGVNSLIEDKKWFEKFSNIPRELVLRGIRSALEKVRFEIECGKSEKEIKEIILNIKDFAEKEIKKTSEYSLRRVINATGVILHTNLGRSLISEEIMEHISGLLTHYSNLEYDLKEGKRGSRYSHAVEIIREITGAEDAMLVNNNAAAVILVLNTLAKGKEVITSRGELVEIGGAFRIPDVMQWSGAKLIEVGTTNKTHFKDYEAVITEETAAILKVHTSNYRVIGFTESVSVGELKKFGLPVIEDLGSGVIIDLSHYGIEKEPTVKEALKNGADIVTFSGDKLLGGPQAGIIVGGKKFIEKMKKNPLTRALRVDKFTLAALEATMRFYLNETEKIPTIKMLTEPKEKLKEKAERLHKLVTENYKSDIFRVEPTESQVGGGSLPITFLPSYALVADVGSHKAEVFERALRSKEIPIIARISENKVILDMRTVQDDEYEIIAKELINAAEIL